MNELRVLSRLFLSKVGLVFGFFLLFFFFKEKGGWVGEQHAGKSTNGLKATLES